MRVLVLLLLGQTAGVYSGPPPSNAPGTAVRVVTRDGGTVLQVEVVSGGGGASITGPISVNMLDGGPPLNINPPASLPLPTGAATSGLQSTGNTSLSNIDGKTATLVSGRTPVDPSGVVSPVSGPVTDTQLRASPVPVSGPVTDTQLRATPVPVSGPVTDTQLRASPVPVSGPVTDTQLRASPVPVSTPDGGTLWLQAMPDGGIPASDDAVQRSATDLAAIRRLLEQLVALQQDQAVQLQALKETGK